MNVQWQVKHFSELTTAELYAIVQLRLEVFSVEQNCAYQDADGKDQASFHLWAQAQDGSYLAYARILPAGVSYKEASIGRVVTSRQARSKGIGKQLMQRSLEFVKEKYGSVPVRIGAQCYLKKFYSGFGFSPEGAEYLEDNIPHIHMLRASINP